MNNNRKQHLIKTSTKTTYIKFRNKKIRVFWTKQRIANSEFSPRLIILMKIKTTHIIQSRF